MSKKYKCLAIYLIPYILFSSFNVPAVSKTAVVTLTYPHGARQYGMGEVGTALADDAHVLFWNPAGLGMPSEYQVESTYFYEPFQLPDLYHKQSSFYNKFNSNQGIFGYGIDFNFINMGENDLTDERARFLRKVHSYEYVLTIGYGFSLGKTYRGSSAVGFSAKYIYSTLAPGGNSGERVGQAFAFDFGYITTIAPNLRFGTTFTNMGINIHYIDENIADPLPFAINIALAYKRPSSYYTRRLLNFTGEIRLSRIFVENKGDGKPDPFYKAIWTDLARDSTEKSDTPTMLRFGSEWTFVNTFSLRIGYLLDIENHLIGRHQGLGLKISPAISFDWYQVYASMGHMEDVFKKKEIYAIDESHKQWGFSFTYHFGHIDTFE